MSIDQRSLTYFRYFTPNIKVSLGPDSFHCYTFVDTFRDSIFELRDRGFSNFPMLFWWPWPCHIIVCLIHYLKYFRFRCVFSKSARLISGSYSCWVREDVRSSGSPTTLNRSSKTTLEQEIRFNMTPKKNCHPKTKSSEKIDDSCLPIRNLSKDLKNH